MTSTDTLAPDTRSSDQGIPHRITCADVQVGDYVARVRAANFDRVIAINEGPASRRLIFTPGRQGDRRQYGVNIRPNREAKLWRLGNSDNKGHTAPQRKEPEMANSTTTEHSDTVKELLKAAGLSEQSELTADEAKAAEELAAAGGTVPQGEALLKALRSGKKATPRKKYSDAVMAVHERVLKIANDAGLGKPPVPKQTAAVVKALGDKPATEALGLSANAIRDYAKTGKRPKDTEQLGAFIKAHKALKDDANLGPRKTALIAYAAASN